jgi:hypothetical protein
MNILKCLKFKVKLNLKLNFKVAVPRPTEILWKKTSQASASCRSLEIPPTALHGVGNKLSFSCKIPAPDGLKY